ncbi:hypothetical protein [Sinomicrobium sp. M5D2P9]
MKNLIKSCDFLLVITAILVGASCARDRAEDELDLDGNQPDLRPEAGSGLLHNPTSFTGLPGYFQQVTYRGTFGPSDTWMDGMDRLDFLNNKNWVPA